jgi:hypothetical protein
MRKIGENMKKDDCTERPKNPIDVKSVSYWVDDCDGELEGTITIKIGPRYQDTTTDDQIHKALTAIKNAARNIVMECDQ